jgi:hypothetical protein
MLPAGTTDVDQTVDDNVGKTLRNMANKEFSAELEKFDFDANPDGKIAASEKRKMTARIYNKVIGEFNNDKNKLSMLMSSATRTGLALAADHSNLKDTVPVKYGASFLVISSTFLFPQRNNRFPPDFGATLLAGHPLATDVVEYVPYLAVPTPPRASATSQGPSATASATVANGTARAMADETGATAVAVGLGAAAEATGIRAQASAFAPSPAIVVNLGALSCLIASSCLQ